MREKNACTLLLEVETSEDFMEMSIQVTEKVKNGAAMWFRNDMAKPYAKKVVYKQTGITIHSYWYFHHRCPK